MPIPRDDAPLIVTARLDAPTFAMLDALRGRHFPAAFNKVPAHISLFHHLPGNQVDTIIADTTEVCRESAGFDLHPAGVRFLGRGVAFAYTAVELDRLHAALARKWVAWLTAQDRQPFKPHVTIQNKAEPQAARRLFEALREEPPPACHIEGISIWRYLGGPWEAVADIGFGV